MCENTGRSLQPVQETELVTNDKNGVHCVCRAVGETRRHVGMDLGTRITVLMRTDVIA